MKPFSILLLISIPVFFGCSKEIGIDQDCMQEVIAKHEMVEYDGREIGCQSFLELYHYKNKQYFVLNNHCLDMIIYPVDCDGNRLCIEDDFQCRRFWRKAELIEIIGISKL